jgi:ribosomal protein L11 methyltransferase
MPPRLATHRFTWTKRTPAASADSWFATLFDIGPERLMITETVGSKSAKVQAHGLTSKEAQQLRAIHGGSVNEAKWLTAQNPPQRAPIRVRGKFSVVSTELEKTKEMKAGRAPAIWIPAGMAFGTGEHATTAMCLRHLADTAQLHRGSMWSFLDLGTGSGILAMAAQLLGAKDVLGTDFDPHSIRTAKENATNNSIRGIKFSRSDVLRWTPPQTWDIVASNLFSGVLIEAAPVISSAVAPGGHLILSGVLREQEAEVLKSFKREKLGLLKVTRKGKWISAVLKRPPALSGQRQKPKSGRR